ncbi:MAG: transglycosylase domain-containing protein [Minisyncoccia bacterium]
MHHEALHPKSGAKHSRFVVALQIAGIVILCGFILLFIIALYYAKTLPTFQDIATAPMSSHDSTRFYDRTGTILLYQIGVQHTTASFNQFPQTLKDATVAIEDQAFYTEPAFSWKSILRAAYVDLTHGGIVQGGSTITQQVARNAFLTLDQTFSRKLKELILAIRIGQIYSKDQILNLYLNDVSYGPTLTGAETASEAYFGVPATQLDIAQSAVLAAIPNAPTYYSPWGSHVNDLLTRQKLVLQRMYDLKKITKTQFNGAVAEKITFQPQSIGGIKAPHFVMAVEEYLVQKYGEAMVDNTDMKVITTLDWNLQQEAETAISQGVAQNQKLYQGGNGALVAQDPKTGQILALVGSSDYFNIANDGNFDVATQGLRQPGSSLKPFVYLTAFAMGYTPDTVLFDVPTEFSTIPACPAVPDFTSTNTTCFHPQDFEQTFAGPMSIRIALAQSVNIPAVKTLYLVGINNAISTIHSFGVTTLNDPDSYGLSLVLGGGAVHLIDLTEAYSVLAADGVKHAQTMVLQVQDANSNVLESYADQATQVADPQNVRLINDVLSDATARAGLFQNSMNLTVFPGYDVALKTGTSNDYRDAWSMGYTPDLVVGVWAGNNDNTPMQRNGSSILAAVPMWHAFMAQAVTSYPADTFPAPAATTPSKPILAGNYTAGNQIHTILYYVSKNDPTGPDPSNPASDPQFKNWETGVINWAKQNIPNFATGYNQ